MAKLTSAARNKLPKSSYGMPGSKKYPMPDKSHAANAKARATQMVNKGKLSKSAESSIDAKANKILGKKSSSSASSKMRDGDGDYDTHSSMKPYCDPNKNH